ncbi:MAG: methyl-accepting chemotaxis protein, partial [Lachnospiraceae bacterium]|nr:methyl-accepting chemotaxis protein [Lachnospiraceae bacterium]
DYKTAKDQSFLFMVVLVILACGLNFFIVKAMFKPLDHINDALDTIAYGQIGKKVDEKLVKRADELGLLSENIEKTRESLYESVSKIMTSADSVKNAVSNQQQKLDVLRDNLTDVASSSEEITASCEDASANVTMISESTSELKNVIAGIAEKASEGAKASDHMNQEAEKVKADSEASIANAKKLLNESITILKKAIEDSKEVEKINSLSDSILEISSQTNLLALNASIEAARAGEAGRGFAVVAGEIGKLASDTNNTVSTIKEVAKNLIGAVENLSSCAKDIMSFLETTVISDYENMVAVGEQYSINASNIKAIVDDFSQASEEVYQEITTMADMLVNTSKAVEESSIGVTRITENNADISERAGDIYNIAEETSLQAEDLIKAVKKFEL